MNNSLHSRINTEMESLSSKIEEKARISDGVVRSQMEEFGQLMHNVHADVEATIAKHKQDYTELNFKQTKMQEVAHRCLDSVEEAKEVHSKMGTMLTCLVEYCNIGQALGAQDETDVAK